MQKNAWLDDAPAAPITPETLAKVKKQDMNQAVVERFRKAAPARPVKDKHS